MSEQTLREKILNAQDDQVRRVVVPEWDVELDVRGMSARERADFLKSVSDENGLPDVTRLFPTIVQLCSYDPEDGNLVFEPGDMDAINAKNGAAVQRVADVALEVSGLGAESKNLGKGSLLPNDGSTSSSPPSSAG